jgi:hypothetical protein
MVKVETAVLDDVFIDKLLAHKNTVACPIPLTVMHHLLVSELVPA